jgi:hypothetical protein
MSDFAIHLTASILGEAGSILSRTRASLAPAKPVLRILDGVDGPAATASKCQGAAAGAPQRGRPSMKEFVRIGADLGKDYFQVHELESEVRHNSSARAG